jgi:hypothetical protein
VAGVAGVVGVVGMGRDGSDRSDTSSWSLAFSPPVRKIEKNQKQVFVINAS